MYICMVQAFVRALGDGLAPKRAKAPKGKRSQSAPAPDLGKEAVRLPACQKALAPHRTVVGPLRHGSVGQ
jgi:hypothetical protein